MTTAIIEKQRKLYGENFQIYGDTPNGFYWNNTETQELRFSRLMRTVLQYENTACKSPSAFSLHEVGCGTADLHHYLLRNEISHEYSGTEIVPEMIEVCRTKFPRVKILERDIACENSRESYDYLVLSGVLNLRGDTNEKDWKNYCMRLLSKMFTMSERGIAFNFLTSYTTTPQNPTLQYFAPHRLFEFCHENLSRFIEIDTIYPLYEVTITVFKEEWIQESFSNTAFQKYFSNPG